MGKKGFVRFNGVGGLAGGGVIIVVVEDMVRVGGTLTGVAAPPTEQEDVTLSLVCTKLKEMVVSIICRFLNINFCRPGARR